MSGTKTIKGTIAEVKHYNKIGAATITTEGRQAPIRWWLSAPFTDALVDGSTVTVELQQRPKRDKPDEFDAFVITCNGVAEKQARPAGGGGGGKPQENPRDRVALMLTAYAKDLMIEYPGMAATDAAETVSDMFMVIRERTAKVVNT